MSSGRNANGKREIESIDLTGSDDVLLQSRPRKTARQNPMNGPSQSLPHSWTAPALTQESTPSQRAAWNDEDDADAVIILSQGGDNTAAESVELYGMRQTNTDTN